MNMLHECDSSLKQAKEVLKYETNTPAGEKLANLIENSTKEFNKFLERNKIDLVELKEKADKTGETKGNDINGK